MCVAYLEAQRGFEPHAGPFPAPEYSERFGTLTELQIGHIGKPSSNKKSTVFQCPFALWDRPNAGLSQQV
jgi:hypothetical protein